MKEKFLHAHMDAAFVYSKLSYCVRKQVGCVIVKNDRIISIGYNGMPPGWENVCEDDNGLSKPEVIHAEANAVAKLARSNDSAEGATCFITCGPCLPCAKLLHSAGVKEVYYAEEPRGVEGGVEHLHACNVKVEQLDYKNKNTKEQQDASRHWITNLYYQVRRHIF